MTSTAVMYVSLPWNGSDFRPRFAGRLEPRWNRRGSRIRAAVQGVSTRCAHADQPLAAVSGNGASMTNGTGKVALVTGATSGIGLEISGTLARDGHRVFLCSRRPDAVAATVKQLQHQGLDVDGTSADVTSPDDVDRLVQACVERFGPVDILVNNAGRPGGGETAELPDGLWLDVINANLNSVFLVSKRVLTLGGMRARGVGRIINIASTGGKQGVVHAAP